VRQNTKGTLFESAIQKQQVVGSFDSHRKTPGERTKDESSIVKENKGKIVSSHE
jgi:hypothetical protein